MITLRPVLASDAPLLYPHLAGLSVLETILWDGDLRRHSPIILTLARLSQRPITKRWPSFWA